MMPRLPTSLLLATLLIACGACGTLSEPEHTAPAPEPTRAAGPSASTEGAASPEPNAAATALNAANVAVEARYLLDPDTGAVAMDVPPAILADVRTQLIASGQTAAADNLARLYDLESGHVRDEGKARAAEVTLRSTIQGGAR